MSTSGEKKERRKYRATAATVATEKAGNVDIFVRDEDKDEELFTTGYGTKM